MEDDRQARGPGRSPQPSTSSGAVGKRRRSDDNQESAPKRTAQAERPTRARGFDVLSTNPHANADPRRIVGEGGKDVKLLANYFEIKKRGSPTFYKHHVEFDPEVLAPRYRAFLLAQHRERLGGYLFVGNDIFLVEPLSTDSQPVVFESKNRDNETFKLTIKQTKTVKMTEPEHFQVLNLILHRAMNTLDLQQIKRGHFDPKGKISNQELVRNFNIELWPGYETSIRQHKENILMGANVVFKVMRTDTVYALMEKIFRTNRGNFQNAFKNEVIGLVVLTNYNNKTYRIDDVTFDQNPESTFPMKDKSVTYVDYYKQKYGIDIHDKKQPLLITNLKEKALRGNRDQLAMLIPELCYMTGLTEEQKTNFELKKLMKPYVQAGPGDRIKRLIAFNQRFANEKCREIFREFNMGLSTNLVSVPGRVLQPEKLVFARGERYDLRTPSWERECGTKLMFQPVELRRWFIVYNNRSERESKNFVRRLIQICQKIGFAVSEPKFEAIRDERSTIQKIDDCVKHNPQMIVFLLESKKADLYGSIKKKCCSTYGVNSQVVTKKILMRERGLDSVITKVGIQMCTKLGGAPWSVVIPLKGVMTIGFDISKDSQNKNISYGALVATMDLQVGADFYSTVSRYEDAETMSVEFSLNVVKALRVYQEKHQALPAHIFIYRGGVGDGQVRHIKETEVENLKARLKDFYKDAPLKLIFIIVSKRINTRLFRDQSNPEAGTVVDQVITLPERYEFFLIPQSVTQGTVTPTNFNVIEDTTEIPAGRVQIWSYKQCHLYYNWSGTTRVPAVMQYATKLSFLIANFVHNRPHESLDKRLYFL